MPLPKPVQADEVAVRLTRICATCRKTLDFVGLEPGTSVFENTVKNTRSGCCQGMVYILLDPVPKDEFFKYEIPRLSLREPHWTVSGLKPSETEVVVTQSQVGEWAAKVTPEVLENFKKGVAAAKHDIRMKREKGSKK